MTTLILAHAHDQAKCQVVYAASRGYDSPGRGLDALAACANGEHRIYWTVDADNARTRCSSSSPTSPNAPTPAKCGRVAMR
jgi:hypothetical protein